jgi:uncharacterized protein YqjF (DUF2071 family)
MPRFLSAKWNDLIMANYEVDRRLLASRVPRGTELDLHDGRCFVSLVGFMFLNTRVMGLPIPFHINFEEVNLRFYVIREIGGELRRGVVFIKEIVPRYVISAVARAVYGEPYKCWKMHSRRTSTLVSYAWQKGTCKNRLSVVRGTTLGIPPENSHGSFIIEHYWGYTARGPKRTDEYRVEHPKWELMLAHDEVIDVDFGRTYGDEFAFLGGRQPYSVLFTEGSEIAVYRGTQIR